MALKLRLDDEQDHEWKVCVGGARQLLRVEWSELEDHNLPYEPEIDYEYRIVTWFFLPPVALGRGVLQDSGDRRWTSSIPVTAGRVLTRYVEVRVPSRQDPPNHRRFALIPRASVWCSLALLSLFLSTVAVLMATTLATLHLNFTANHAIAGVGSLVVLKAIKDVLAKVSPHLGNPEPPFLGLGYVVGRTLAACVLGGVLIWLVPTRCMTSVINDKDAKVELRLPGSSQPVSLGPGQRITFFGTSRTVSERLVGSLVDADRERFCLIDGEGQGQGGAEDSQCEPSSSQAAPPAEPGWVSKLQPSPLRIGCRKQRWQGLDEEGATQLGWEWEKLSIHSDAMVEGSDRELRLDGGCLPQQASPRARIVLEGSGYSVTYEVPRGWRLSDLDRATRLVVDATSRDAVKLQTRTKADASGPESQGILFDIHIDGAGSTAALRLPRPHDHNEFTFSIGTPSGHDLVEQSVVTCTRSGVDIGNHFRLQQLELGEGSMMSRLLALRAEGAELLGWSSQWINTRPSADRALEPWICAAAVGEGAGGKVVAPTDLGDVMLTLQVEFPRRDERWSLRIPEVYVGSRIEIKARSGDAVGSLVCSTSQKAQAFAIGPLWVRDAAGRRVHGSVVELVVEESSDGRSRARSSDPLEPSRGSSWYSRWESTGNRGEEFPPWTCRPITEGDPGCLGCGQDGDTDPAKAHVKLGDGRGPRSASVDLGTSRVTLDMKPQRTCYFDVHYTREVSCASTRCDVASPERRDAINRDLGKSCPIIIACPRRGEPCPT